MLVSPISCAKPASTKKTSGTTEASFFGIDRMRTRSPISHEMCPYISVPLPVINSPSFRPASAVYKFQHNIFGPKVQRLNKCDKECVRTASSLAYTRA
jgi:hypothetical protein